MDTERKANHEKADAMAMAHDARLWRQSDELLAKYFPNFREHLFVDRPDFPHDNPDSKGNVPGNKTQVDATNPGSDGLVVDQGTVKRLLSFLC